MKINVVRSDEYWEVDLEETTTGFVVTNTIIYYLFSSLRSEVPKVNLGDLKIVNSKFSVPGLRREDIIAKDSLVTAIINYERCSPC